MLANPKPGDLVRLAYRKALHPIAPLQGAVGVVEIISRGKPRNHGVRLGGRLVVVPCGHLVKLGPLAHLLDWRDPARDSRAIPTAPPKQTGPIKPQPRKH